MGLKNSWNEVPKQSSPSCAVSISVPNPHAFRNIEGKLGITTKLPLCDWELFLHVLFVIAEACGLAERIATCYGLEGPGSKPRWR
jgi:hypothetical protein